MRPTSARVATWTSLFCVLVALFAFPNLIFAQNRSNAKRQLPERPLLSTPALTAVAPVHLAARAVNPPNTSDSWTGSGDGTHWSNAGNWSAGVPNSSTVDVTIGTTTASVIGDISAQLGNLTLSHAADSLTLNNGTILTIFGSSINNAGTITLGGINFGTGLTLQGNLTLSGGGTVMLSNSTQNFIGGAATTDVLTNKETIQGAGNIGNGQIGLTNSGTINANQTTALIIQDGFGAGATNTGTIEATAGGKLELLNTTFTNTGGTISANGSTLQVNGSTINGGHVTLTGASLLQMNTGAIHGGSTLTNSATGTIELVSGVNTLGGTINNSAGGTFKLDNGAVLNLEGGTYSQLGTVQVNGVNFATGIALQGNVTLSGGTVTMSNSTQNFIGGAATTDVLTNAGTIQGAGNLGNGQIGLVNSGTINANASNNIIISVSNSNFNNTGTIEATGGTLTIQGPGSTFFTNDNQTTNTLSGGTYIANGHNIQWAAGSGGIKTLSANVTEANGGQLFNTTNSANALAGLTSITSTGALTIGGVTFTDAGGFSNAGSLTILPGESFTVGSLAQISGGALTAGTYVLDANLNLSGAAETITTNAANLTLAGGTIHNSSGGTNALAGLATNTGKLTIGGHSNNVSTTAASFSNTGMLTINGGDSFTAAKLTQISGSTLSGGTFVLGGNLDLTTSGINITTNSSTLTLQGGTIMSGATNALANLNTNTRSLTLAGGANFTTTGNFTNSGTMTINSGSTLGITGTLTNLSAGTLTGGTYTVGGTMQLASANGGITTNAANLTLTGTSAKILDGTSNALSSFNNNTGTFTLASAATLTTAAGNFTNSGTVMVSKGTTLTVGGTGNSYNQSAGTTTVDGTLVGNGTTGISVTGGRILGAGALTTNVSIGGGGATPNINVGDLGKAGLLKITGTYAQLSTGTMNVSIGGTTVGTQFSQLQVSGTASLGGMLTAALVSGFTPTVGQTFTVLTASSVAGTFSNSTIAINSAEHFAVSYTSTGVVLTVASGPVSKSASTALVSQMVAASTKQAISSAKPIVLSSRLKYKIHGGGTLGADSFRSHRAGGVKPILVAGLRPAGGHSNAIMERAWERNSIGTSHTAPVFSSWKRIPEKLTQAARATSVSSMPQTSMRQTMTASGNWSEMKQDLNLRPTIASPLRFPTYPHGMPAKILSQRMLRMPIMRLGR
jgi:fibronectin-binding autotransporter adhesin